MGQSRSLVTNTSSASPKTRESISWNPKIHNRVQKSQPFASTRSQISRGHVLASCCPKTHFNTYVLSSYPRLGLPNRLFPSGFTETMCGFVMPSMHATYPTHLSPNPLPYEQQVYIQCMMSSYDKSQPGQNKVNIKIVNFVAFYRE